MQSSNFSIKKTNIDSESAMRRSNVTNSGTNHVRSADWAQEEKDTFIAKKICTIFTLIR